jgi:hypothetical protein
VGKRVAPMKKAIETKSALRKVTSINADALEEQVRPKSQSVETVPFALE